MNDFSNEALLSDLDEKLIQKLKALYSEPGRFYHDWSHVLACLKAFQEESFTDTAAAKTVRYAILFHDAVYVAGAKDNESNSAELASELLSENSEMDPYDISQVYDLIMLTKDHWAHTDNMSPDVRLFLDIDIGILGQPWPAYLKYCEGIRNEWKYTGRSELIFDLGRIAFLKKISAQKNVFLTEDYQKKYDNQAKENILREIKEIVEQHGLFFRLFYLILEILSLFKKILYFIFGVLVIFIGIAITGWIIFNLIPGFTKPEFKEHVGDNIVFSTIRVLGGLYMNYFMVRMGLVWLKRAGIIKGKVEEL